jgi:hypothetical protein
MIHIRLITSRLVVARVSPEPCSAAFPTEQANLAKRKTASGASVMSVGAENRHEIVGNDPKNRRSGEKPRPRQIGRSFWCDCRR